MADLAVAERTYGRILDADEKEGRSEKCDSLPVT